MVWVPFLPSVLKNIHSEAQASPTAIPWDVQFRHQMYARGYEDLDIVNTVSFHTYHVTGYTSYEWTATYMDQNLRGTSNCTGGRGGEGQLHPAVCVVIHEIVNPSNEDRKE